MSIIYIGVRVELPGRIIKHDIKNILKQYNAEGDSQILDLKIDGKITVEKTKYNTDSSWGRRNKKRND